MIQTDYLLSLPLPNVGKLFPLQICWPTPQSTASSCCTAVSCGRTGDTGTPSVTSTSSQICSTSKHPTHLNPAQVSPRQARPVLSCPVLSYQSPNRESTECQRVKAKTPLSPPPVPPPPPALPIKLSPSSCVGGGMAGREVHQGGRTFSPAPLHHIPLQP